VVQVAKIIITAAASGATHVPSLSPHLPYTPGDIAKHAILGLKGKDKVGFA